MLSIAPPLRTAAVSCRLQPAIANTYQTSSISTRRTQEPKSLAISQSTTTKPLLPTTRLSKVQTRHYASAVSESHSTAGSTTPTSQTKASASSSSTTAPQITWNTFFTLRKRRRWWQMGSSVASCATTTVGGIASLTMVDPAAFASAIPQIDPLITMGLSTTALGVVGWMVGPFLGTAIWKARNRGVVEAMEAKEKYFYSRIKIHRVDPAGSSMQNPVPDYYGEKIGSVQDYRRWLKDQRAFNKKRLASIL